MRNAELDHTGRPLGRPLKPQFIHTFAHSWRLERMNVTSLFTVIILVYTKSPLKLFISCDIYQQIVKS